MSGDDRLLYKTRPLPSCSTCFLHRLAESCTAGVVLGRRKDYPQPRIAWQSFPGPLDTSRPTGALGRASKRHW
jgi:hypothetical protein